MRRAVGPELSLGGLPRAALVFGLHPISARQSSLALVPCLKVFMVERSGFGFVQVFANMAFGDCFVLRRRSVLRAGTSRGPEGVAIAAVGLRLKEEKRR